MSQELSQKAMLVRLTISKWTARKEDKKVSKEVADKYGTDQERGRYRKVLIAKEALQKIDKAANKARNFHYEQTLPWQDDGSRILPANNYFYYTLEMRRLRRDFEEQVSYFIDAYPSLVDQARLELNGLFNPDDYPSLEKISKKFSFEAKVDPMPTGADFWVDLQADEVDRIRRNIEDRTEQATAQAMRDLWDRLHAVVSRMSERLSDPDNTFRDSLVGNILDLVDLLPRLNLTGDARLEAMRREVSAKLTCYPPQTLRDDHRARKDTAQAANDILAAMAGYCEAV